MIDFMMCSKFTNQLKQTINNLFQAKTKSLLQCKKTNLNQVNIPKLSILNETI